MHIVPNPATPDQHPLHEVPDTLPLPPGDLPPAPPPGQPPAAPTPGPDAIPDNLPG